MGQPNYIESQDILNATNGGLDIILDLYPQAIGSDKDRNRKFKTREEKTASANLRKADDGNWLVTDFGNDSQPRNAIGCYMLEKSLGFVDTIRILAARYNVVSQEQAQQLIRADYSSRPANPDEDEKVWTWKVRDSFTDHDIEAIISKNVLKHLGYKLHLVADPKSIEAQKNQDAYAKISAAFKRYYWHPLQSYSLVKDRTVHTFSSNDQYPIFLIHEEHHQKIYQPKHPDKSKRFMYHGAKPKDFMHGLVQLRAQFEKNKKLADEQTNDDAEELDRGVTPAPGEPAPKASKKKSPKVREVILCTGGSDAINVHLMDTVNHWVVWLNGETAKFPGWMYNSLNIYAQKIYQLPDIDITGKREAHKIAMEYLEIFTIDLPEELKKFKDPRGNACKDVRDFLNHYSAKEFDELKSVAMPYRFWEQKPRYEGKGDERVIAGYDYDFNNVYAYNFLMKNGYGRLGMGDKKTDWVYINVTGNIVKEVSADEVQDFLHYFLETRRFDIRLRNAMYQTSRLNDSSLARLKALDIDFTDYTANSQFVFFKNKTVEVTREKITYHKPGNVERFIWEDDLLQHRLEEAKEPPFVITKDELDNYDIEVTDNDCLFLKYLVQTSRVHWRKEIETGEGYRELTPAQRETYQKVNHCNIAGPLLSPEEVEEQKQHLVNKIFCIGFLMHRYKARNKGWFIWAMDNKNSDDGKSHGGSGKSILFDQAMRHVVPKSFFINGRNNKITDDPHKYDGITEHYKYLLVDDAHEYLKLEVFYPDITADMNVNPKGKKPFSIPFEKSPKMAFTSNYSPRDLGPSTERRMIYAVFSDWYHNKGETDDYLQQRDPSNDLGCTMFTGFDEPQWNKFYITMLHCLQFFLTTDERIRPAMENVNKRQLLAVMGNLLDWALVYFGEVSDRLDVFTVREEAYTDYTRYNGSKVTPQLFSTRLKAFCRYYGYVINPKVYQDKKGKIIKKVEHKIYVQASGTWEPIAGAPKVAREMIYIQTKDQLASDPDNPEPLAPVPQLPDDEKLPF